MCGIVSIFNYRVDKAIDREELRNIRDHMWRRGPDGKGEWFSADGRVGMGHRRLSIIDLSERASQPMLSEDGSIVVSFNGEIYNYQGIKKRLSEKGVKFTSSSDTEVLIKLYQEKGEGMVSELRGMFAFALWDNQKKAMLLVRDPYGIKPLYYADNGQTLRAASQVQALLTSLKVSKVPESAGAVGFFLLGSVPEPFTLFQEIRSVPAGSYLWVTERGVSKEVRYFSLAEIFHEAAKVPERFSKEEKQKVIHSALLDSVRHHFVSDVEVGIFLSSGMDSSLLVALAHEAGIRNLNTGTLAFEEFKGTIHDEAPLAEEVAKKFQTKHQTRIITRSEFKAEFPKIMEAMDQPTIDGINTYFISKVMSERNLKVALSGLGGDELFGGYPSFKQVPNIVQYVSLLSKIPGIKIIYKKLFSAAKGLAPILSPKLSGLMDFGGTCAGAYFLRRGLFLPWELTRIMDPDFTQLGLQRLQIMESLNAALKPNPGSSFACVSVLESTWYLRNQLLRDTDWTGMAHSLEIRTPYVDKSLSQIAAPLNRMNQGVSKEPLAQILTNNGLKLKRKVKTGFSIPVLEWSSCLNEEPAQISLNKKAPWIRRWAGYVFSRAGGVLV